MYVGFFFCEGFVEAVDGGLDGERGLIGYIYIVRLL